MRFLLGSLSLLFACNLWALDFKSQDALLNASYESLKACIDAASFKEVRTAQRLWIKYRDASCAISSLSDNQKSECLALATKHRALELKGIEGIYCPPDEPAIDDVEMAVGEPLNEDGEIIAGNDDAWTSDESASDFQDCDSQFVKDEAMKVVEKNTLSFLGLQVLDINDVTHLHTKKDGTQKICHAVALLSTGDESGLEIKLMKRRDKSFIFVRILE